MKWRIIRRQNEARETEAARRGVRVIPDRTFKERQSYAKLVKERDEKNKCLEETGMVGKKWIITARGALKEVPLGRHNNATTDQVATGIPPPRPSPSSQRNTARGGLEPPQHQMNSSEQHTQNDPNPDPSQANPTGAHASNL